jgi:hypothetical protein
MYEVKFVMGALAASLATNHRIGYLAFSPIYGSISEVNAFALGAALVDPSATIHLKWLSVSDDGWEQELRDAGAEVIAGVLYSRYHKSETPMDVCLSCGCLPSNLATPIWDWGRYYELLVRSFETSARRKKDSA